MSRFFGVLAALCLSLCLAMSAGHVSGQEDAVDPFADDPTLPDDLIESVQDPADDVPQFTEPETTVTPDDVVTPTPVPTERSQTASSITVITAEQLDAGRQSTVTEILRGVPGVDVVQSGQVGGVSSVFMRGGNGAHTKVLVDGVPINDPSNPNRALDFSTLIVDNIERVEVLRGPQSILYGTDAIGGVINIITRRGTGPGSLRSTSMAGSFGTGRQSLTVGGGDDRRHYSLSAFFLHTDGISSADKNAGNTERDGYRNLTFSGRMGWTPSERFEIDYVFRYTDSEVDVDAFAQFPAIFNRPIDDAPFFDRRNHQQTFYNRIQFRNVAFDGMWENKFGFNLTDYVRSDSRPTAFERPHFEGQTRVADWQSNLLLTENNTFTVGASYLHEEFFLAPAMAFFPGVRRPQNSKSLYLHDQFSFRDVWFATAGVRWDQWSIAGQAKTYRVTNQVVIPNTGWSVHGTIGTAFRAPSLADVAAGNPAIRPERSKGWDVGARKEMLDGRLSFDATYFRNDFDDLITFRFVPGPGFIPINVGQARAMGVELTALWEIDPQTSLSASYTLTDSVDLDPASPNFDKPLLRRPQDKASLTVFWHPTDHWDVNMSVLYVGTRLDNAFLNVAPFSLDVLLDHYTLFNLATTYRWSERCELFARADNLFDAEYQEVFGFGTRGASGYGGVSLLW